MSSDSFELLLNQFLKDLRIVNDNLALIGLFYLGKNILKSTLCLSKALKVYLLPRLMSNEAWIKSHGQWAILSG